MNMQQHLARIHSGIHEPSSNVDSAQHNNIAILHKENCERSWRRCLEGGLSPDEKAVVPVVDNSELRHMQQEFGEQAYGLAVEELNGLMNVVSEVGYSASLANAQGVIIAESVKPSQAFYCESDRVGSVWSEAVGGTNGIGTCIVEQRPIAVFRNDHFYYDLSTQACVATPFYSPFGDLQGVLNLTTCNPSVDLNAHHIVYKLATQSSSKLEKRLFITYFQDCSIIQLTAKDSMPALLAIDCAGVIQGATLGARTAMGLEGHQIGQRKLWEIIDCPQSAISLEIFRAPTVVHLLSTQQPLEFVLLGSPVLQSWIEAPRARTRQQPVMEETRSALMKYAGQDPRMLDNMRLVRKVLNKGLPLLLLGETGVGKDTLAKAIHQESERSKASFIAFNCAAVPESLIDSELFGYSKGAFTGAHKDGSQGRFLEAHGGTLFLDEIGDMPLALQTRLLRVLESGEVCPLGGGKAVHVDVQIIAATNQSLHDKVADGSFREDLFFRLAGMIIDVPALRERKDKALLIESIMRGLCTEGEVPKLNQAAWKKLLKYSWPGNIRELRHVLHRASLLIEGDEIRAGDIVLPFENRIRAQAERFTSSSTPVPAPVSVSSPAVEPEEFESAASPDSIVHIRGVNARSTLAEVEGRAVAQALADNAGNIDKAGEALGMSKATLYRKIKRYGLRP